MSPPPEEPIPTPKDATRAPDSGDSRTTKPSSSLSPHTAADSRSLQRLGDDLQRARIERLFHSLDLNRDGRIDVAELERGLEKLGYGHVTKEHLYAFLKKSDKSEDGFLDIEEFTNHLIAQERELHFHFESLDEDKDGRLNLDEIVSAFKKMGIVINRGEAEKLSKRINSSDNSLDISYEEWRDFLLFHPSTELYELIQSWRHNTCVDYGEDIGVPDDFSEEDIITGAWWRHLVAGGVAGAVSRTCTAPLDRTKIFLQVHGGRKRLSILDAMKYMLQEGGVRGLWRGNGMNIIKIAPESAFKFAAYDVIKRWIRGGQDRDLFLYERFAAGSLAGGISQSVIYPLEVLKTRMALRKTNEVKGIADCVVKLYQRDGAKGFYRGYVPNLLGIIPYAGIDLAVYETLKNRYLLEYHSDGSAPPAFALLSFGTFSSCCGQVAAYPLALVRTKLQSQAGMDLNLPKEQTHTLGLFKFIIQSEGPRGLYRGIIPNFCKVAPAVSISYYVYERTRSYLGVEMV